MTDENRSYATFTNATAIHAEGARVGLITCRLCGAAILLDRRDGIDAPQVHRDWHDRAVRDAD